MRTSFHHQSEAQHPKSSAIHKYAGRLPHLMTHSGPFRAWRLLMQINVVASAVP